MIWAEVYVCVFKLKTKNSRKASFSGAFFLNFEHTEHLYFYDVVHCTKNQFAL